MAERPILFSAPMVRAILAGTKTQTRRIVKPLPPSDFTLRRHESSSGWVYAADLSKITADVEQQQRVRWECPFGQPGDRLWVRETHAPQADCWGSWERWTRGEGGPGPVIHYAADAEPAPFIERWRPSIHMPRWASRITLEITGVRVERLHDISADDARAEGCPDKPVVGAEQASVDLMAKLWFHDLWRSINGPASWDANPWVWVVEFKRAAQAGDTP